MFCDKYAMKFSLNNNPDKQTEQGELTCIVHILSA